MCHDSNGLAIFCCILNHTRVEIKPYKCRNNTFLMQDYFVNQFDIWSFVKIGLTWIKLQKYTFDVPLVALIIVIILLY